MQDFCWLLMKLMLRIHTGYLLTDCGTQTKENYVVDNILYMAIEVNIHDIHLYYCLIFNGNLILCGHKKTIWKNRKSPMDLLLIQLYSLFSTSSDAIECFGLAPVIVISFIHWDISWIWTILTGKLSFFVTET